jgi:hypothetical protein
LFVIYDLLHRSLDLTAHYTDDGIAPRDFVLQHLWDPHAFSLHMITGTFFGIALLFLIHGVAAVGLLLGFRTRLMTFVVWLLLSSLHTRNTLILNGGDDLLRVILFFAIFLPLGARYSIDAALDLSKEDAGKSEVYTSPSTAVYYLQFICVYFFAALLKSGPEWRTQGTAIYYALSIDQLALPLGKALLGFPVLMKVMTFVVWWVELLGGFIFLIPHPLAKLAGILLVGALQTGFGLTLALGHFPWVNAIALLPFLPSLVWDNHPGAARHPTFKRRGVFLDVFFDPDCGFCRKAVLIFVEFVRPQLNGAPRPAQGKDLAMLRKRNSWIVREGGFGAAQRDETEGTHFEFAAFIRFLATSSIFFWAAPVLRVPPIRAVGTTAYRTVANHRRFFAALLSPLQFRRVRLRTYWWREALVLFFFAAVLVNNLAPMAAVATLNDFFNIPVMMTRLDEYWGMFAPAPTREDGWYVVEGRLSNGKVIDAFRQKREINYGKPTSAGDFYPNERWRKFMMNIWLKQYKDFRGPFARYLCWDWNRKNSGPDHLDRVTISFMLEMTPPPGEPTHVNRIVLGDYPCME